MFYILKYNNVNKINIQDKWKLITKKKGEWCAWELCDYRKKTKKEEIWTIKIKEKNNEEASDQYYIANIIKVVNALCLDKSQYFVTEIEGTGTIYTVSKYGIYADKTDGADVFKLSDRQQIPIFVSEKFKNLIERENITGISLTEIDVV